MQFCRRRKRESGRERERKGINGAKTQRGRYREEREIEQEWRKE